MSKLLKVDDLLLWFHDLLQNIGFFPIILIIYVISMFIFWRESRLVRKNNNSVFDQWFLSTIFMVLYGRISYMITNWSQFSKLSWFYIPYERYGPQVYLFRLLPWKFFAVWDGGFLFTGLVVAFLFFNFFYVRYIKKWSWKDMMRPVLLTVHFFLGLILCVYGVLLESKNVMLYGVGLLCLVLFTYLLKYLYKVFSKQIISLIGVIYIVVSAMFIAYVFLSGDVSRIDEFNVGVMMLISGLLAGVYYRDSVKTKIKVSSYSQSQSIHTVKSNKVIKPRKRWETGQK